MKNKCMLRSSLLDFENENKSISDSSFQNDLRNVSKKCSVETNHFFQKPFVKQEIEKKRNQIWSKIADQTEILKSTNQTLPVKICVIGIGGAGNNVVNAMTNYQNGLDAVVKKYALNTDQQHLMTLTNLTPSQRVLIRSDRTNGKGSGGNPSVGEKATKDFENEIKQLLQNTDLCIIIAGLGKGTGTGGGPIIAQIAQKMRCATIAFLITPSIDDGNGQFKKSRTSMKNFTAFCDAMSVISNDAIIDKDNTSIFEARSMINRTICKTIDSIVDAVVVPSTQNIDFADLKSFIQRTENVNQLLHLQLNLFDTDSNEIKVKLKTCLDHSLYSTSIEKVSKVLIQFNINNNCDSRVIKNVISEIKHLAKSDELDITTGIRYVQKNEQKNIEIFLVKADLASSNKMTSYHNNDFSKSLVTTTTLSCGSEIFNQSGEHLSKNNKVESRSLFNTGNSVENINDDFDTDKMTAMLKTVLPKHQKKVNLFDDDLLSFSEAKFKN